MPQRQLVCGPGLPVRIGDLPILPFSEPIYLASSRRIGIVDRSFVPRLHDQHEVGCRHHVRVYLASPVTADVFTQTGHQLDGMLGSRVPDHRTEAGRFNKDISAKLAFE